MPGRTEPIAPEMLEEAAHWLMRCRAAPDDAALGAALASWCAADARHAAAFARAERAWAITGDLGALAPAEVIPFPRKSRPPLRWVAAASAIAACAIFAFPALELRLSADHLTGTAMTENVTLADGSVVTLAAESAISSEINENSRRVTLLRGEAYFEVAHDAARPFVVSAKETEIEVLGTAFDVDLGPGETRIAVAHGKVAVRAHGETSTLLAGDGIAIGPEVSTPTRQPDAQIAAWRQGLLVVDNVSIAEVVARIGRYHDGLILVPDADFAARRVTGVFDLKDPAKALRGLVDTQGGRLVTLSPYLTALMAGS